MSEPLKDGLIGSSVPKTTSEARASSNPEPASSSYPMSSGIASERMATAEKPGPVPHHSMELPLRAKEPATTSQTTATDTSKGKSYSNTARMFHSWNAHLRSLYRGKKYRECREGCLHLLESPYVPHYTRIETLQLLSSVAGSADLAQLYLEDAKSRLEKLDSSKEYVQILLSENRIMMETVESHKASGDIRDEEDDLAEDMAQAGDDSPDDPPTFTEQDSAAASTAAEGFDADMDAFLAEREEQERWESTTFQDGEVEDDYDPIEEELAKKRQKAERQKAEQKLEG
ncbi:hypothetical protein KC357_g6798 [Hortaea werneckii]|nr:hypothetical protein KC357_g6798 [Hortaea werneckii]